LKNGDRCDLNWCYCYQITKWGEPQKDKCVNKLFKTMWTFEKYWYFKSKIISYRSTSILITNLR